MSGPPVRWRSEAGLVSTEMAVVMVTFFAGFLMLVVYAGRVGQASNDVRSAAQEAARAASLASSPAVAREVATSTAAANVETSGVGCARGLDVSTDVDDFAPGGTVTVTLSCTASLSDVSSLRLPGARTYTASAIEVIDRFVSTPIGDGP